LIKIDSLIQSRERALKCFRKVDWVLGLSECLKKMVDDERGPCGCDEANRDLMDVGDDAGDPRNQSLLLRVWTRYFRSVIK
jgi:hypothetical protein